MRGWVNISPSQGLFLWHRAAHSLQMTRHAQRKPIASMVEPVWQLLTVLGPPGVGYFFVFSAGRKQLLLGTIVNTRVGPNIVGKNRKYIGFCFYRRPYLLWSPVRAASVEPNHAACSANLEVAVENVGGIRTQDSSWAVVYTTKEGSPGRETSGSMHKPP